MFRSTCVAFVILLASPAARPGGSQVVAARGTAFVGATVLTMGAAGALRDHTVLTRGDTIIAVGPSSSVEVPAGFHRLEARGRFLVPGLMDMHVHLFARSELAANIRHGVTTVLQMSGQRGSIADFMALREEVERGEVAGPRIFTTGPMFDVLGLARQTTAYAIRSADTMPMLMRQHVEAGHDFFKVHNQVPRAVHGALTQGGLPVIGHVPMGMSLQEVLTSGQVMIAHAELFYYNLFGFPAARDAACTDGFWPCMARARADSLILDTVVEQVRASGVTVTADLAYLAAEERVYADFGSVLADPEFSTLDPTLQARWRADGPGQRSFLADRRRDLENRSWFTRMLVARLNARGVPILAGTDAPLPGLFPGKAIHLELQEMVRAGMPATDALRAATSAPGRFLKAHVPRSRMLGEIAPGYAADLVLLSADPLADIAATERIVGTLARGVWYPVGTPAPERR